MQGLHGLFSCICSSKPELNAYSVHFLAKELHRAHVQFILHKTGKPGPLLACSRYGASPSMRRSSGHSDC